MLTRLIICTFVVFAGSPILFAEGHLNTLSNSEQRSGWQLLFDGKTTNGWRNFKSDDVSGGWAVQDGAITRIGKAGDIMTRKTYENFELSLEYRISKGGNSGIMFHVTEDYDTPWKTGPEIQVQDNIDGHDPQKSGWLYQLYKPSIPSWGQKQLSQAGLEPPAEVDATKPPGEWNQVYVRICQEGSEIVVNGVRYCQFKKGSDDWNQRVADSKFSKFDKFGKPTAGYICLQDHGNPVAFRNIKLRELDADGSVKKQPIDGTLALKPVLAFPNLQWEDWEPVDDRGRNRPLRIIELTHANDGTNRLFAATQTGAVHVFDNDPEVDSSKLFLDISEKVEDWKKANEVGLLGLAFSPNYKDDGEFYVYYSLKNKNQSVISRFHTTEDDPNKADPASEEELLRISQPFNNHNGGAIEFGPDGYLYIGMGDGGYRNDPLKSGQDIESLLGKILRIDVSGSAKGRAYEIPPDNPFVDVAGARPEIYAYGFRNIWRLAFDSKTGNLWVGDVGQELWEEVNVVRKGGNYGWSQREGNHLFGNTPAPGDKSYLAPIWEYDHRIGKSITGGRVYRGSRTPELEGMYLYADYVSGRIWALEPTQGDRSVMRNWEIVSGGIPVLAFGEDADGEVYYMTASATGKSIFRFEAEKVAAP